MTTNDIDAIRRLADAADLGPWTAHDDGLVWAERIGDPVSGSAEQPNADFIAAARTHVPALCDEVEQLRTRVADRNASLDRVTAERNEAIAQRDLNGDLLDGAARALGIDLEDPDAHYAYEIPGKVAALVAALTESRANAAKYANENGALVAENARVRQQRDDQVNAMTAAAKIVDSNRDYILNATDDGLDAVEMNDLATDLATALGHLGHPVADEDDELAPRRPVVTVELPAEAVTA